MDGSGKDRARGIYNDREQRLPMKTLNTTQTWAPAAAPAAPPLAPLGERIFGPWACCGHPRDCCCGRVRRVAATAAAETSAQSRRRLPRLPPPPPPAEPAGREDRDRAMHEDDSGLAVRVPKTAIVKKT
jgi:hypothetical protein